MGSGAKNDVRQEINSEQNRVNDQFSNLYNTMEEKRKATEEMSNQERDFLKESLTPLAGSTGGLDQNVVNNIRNTYGGKTVGFEADSGGSSGSGGGGGDSSGGGNSGASPTPANPWAEPEGVYRNFAETGGIEIEKLRSQVAALEEMSKTGAIDPAAAASIQETINKLKSFQFDPEAKARINATISGLEDIARTGGFDPARLATIRGDIDSLRSWAQTGGVDPTRLASARNNIDFMQGGGMTAEDIARYRGTGFQEFADTGGWSMADRANFRDRATSGIPALVKTQLDEANRLKNIQGGGGAGNFLAAQARLNRQGAQNLATANRDAEIDLANNIREGRQWGIEGLRDTENSLQTILGANRTAGLNAGNTLELGVAGNRMAGLRDAAQAGTTLEQNIAANKIGAGEAVGQLQLDLENSINDAFIKAQSGAGTLESNLEQARAANRVKAAEAAATAEATAQKLRQEGQLAGAQGLMQVAAQKEAAANRAAATAASVRANDQANERWWAQYISGNERWIGEQQMQGQQNALRNLTQIYGMDPTLPRDSMQVDIAGQQAAANRGLLGIDAQAASGGKDWTDWAKFGLGAAQGLSNAFGGGGGGGSSTDIYRGDSGAPSGSIYDYGSDTDIGGSIPTGPGSGVWGVPNPQPSEDDWWK